MRRLFALLGVLLTFLFVSCATGTGDADFTREEKNPKYNGPKAKKILLVVITTDPGLRQDLETDWVVQLVKKQISATPSYRVIPNLKDVTKEELQKLVASEGFDGVLVSRPVTGSGSMGEHSNYADWYSRSSMYYADLYGYWNEATIGVFTPTDAPKGTTQYYQLRFEANFYATAGETTLAWTSEAKITTGKESGEARTLYAKRVLDALSKHGLI
jgi:hypothetical protein